MSLTVRKMWSSIVVLRCLSVFGLDDVTAGHFYILRVDPAIFV